MRRKFILRIEHEQAFGNAGLARFEMKAQRLLRQRHSTLVAPMNDDDLRYFVKRWIDLARSFGLRTERQMFAVCEAGAMLRQQGIDIAGDDRARDVFTKSNLPNETAKSIREYARSTMRPS